VDRVAADRAHLLAANNPKQGAGAYAAVLTLLFLYFVRPEDFIKALGAVHLGRITGLIALGAVTLSMMSGRTVKLPRETKLILLLFAQLCLCIPFAYWISGSIAVLQDQYSKAVILAFLVTTIVGSLRWLRQLVFLQAALVVIMVVIALVTHSTDHSGRLSLGDGVYCNANDFALTMAINLPFVLLFLLTAKNLFTKAFWALGALAILYGVMATYSRGGFLAMSLGGLICFWDFIIKGRRLHLAILGGFVALMLLMAVPNHYVGRIATIFTQGEDPTGLSGSSLEARRELLDLSLNVALHHPIFGVGPGNFPVVTGHWQVAHNTYSELAAEAGFPALLIFLLLLRCAYVSIRDARKLAIQAGDRELQLFAGALWASLAAYTLGAFFADTAYELYAYFLLSYIPVFHRIVQTSTAKNAPASAESAGGLRGLGFVNSQLSSIR